MAMTRPQAVRPAPRPVPIAPPATPPPLRFPLWASEEEFCPLCTSYLGEYPGDGQPDDEGATGRWRGRIRRLIGRTAKMTAFLLLIVATAIGVLAATTPSAGQATTLAQALARSRHISWPGPAVPERFA